jgi:hypothetical protein
MPKPRQLPPLEDLQQAIDTLKLGLSDLSEEASKYK